MEIRRCKGAVKPAVVLSLLVAATTVSSGSPFTETISLTGDPAPGGPPGAKFLEFGLSAINDSGSVIFAAGMEPGVAGVTFDDAIGIWRHSLDVLTPVIVGDPAAPGVPGASLETLRSAPQFSNAEAVVADFELETGPGGVTVDNNVGTWLFAEGGDQLLYRTGTSLPGLAADAELSVGFATLNNAGDVAIGAYLRDGIGGITAENDRGLWIRTAESVNLIAQTGASIPGAPPGALLDQLTQSAFNDNRMVVSIGSLREGVGGITDDNSEAVFSSRGGVFSLILREGDLATGESVFDAFQAVAANNDDHVAVHAYLKRGVGGIGFFNDQGIWVETDDGLREIVRSDDPMPGLDGRKFRGFPHLVINDAGHVAFTASSRSVVGFDSVFSEGSDGQLDLVAGVGRQPPGTHEGVGFDFSGIPRLTMNNAGQVAFSTGLTGLGVTEANDFGIWAQDVEGTLELIAREGDAIEVAPGDSRIIQTLNFGGMNEIGQVVFDTIFTDGTSGVFVSSRVAAILAGDFSGNGLVEQGDLDIVLSFWGADALSTPIQFEGDRPVGIIDQGELDKVLSNWGTSSSAAASIPEPATVFLLMIGLAACRLLKYRSPS